MLFTVTHIGDSIYFQESLLTSCIRGLRGITVSYLFLFSFQISLTVMSLATIGAIVHQLKDKALKSFKRPDKQFHGSTYGHTLISLSLK